MPKCERSHGQLAITVVTSSRRGPREKIRGVSRLGGPGSVGFRAACRVNTESPFFLKKAGIARPERVQFTIQHRGSAFVMAPRCRRASILCSSCGHPSHSS